LSVLKVAELNAWYDRSHVVQGMSFEVKQGEIVTIMGRNGAGKTTTLRAIMGLIGRRRGSVRFEGEEILMQPAHTRYRRGLGYVPEERRIVPGLTVRENLRLGLLASPGIAEEAAIIEHITETFPWLRERQSQEATSLSGGEQQMLAIARALVSGPKLLLLDEPSEGIMPLLVEEMFALFRRLRDAGTTIVLVEQNVERALSISDRAYILDQGLIVHTDTAERLLADRQIQDRYCAV
jgi:branched-chain amino acid transport system ATP-binding protein